MDSTSQRSINFSSMHLMVNSAGTHNQLYLAVESTTDHTSQTQVNTLKSAIDDVCDTTRRAPKCESIPEVSLSTPNIARKLYGVNGDVNTLKSAIDDVCDTTRCAPKCESIPEVSLSTPNIARKLYGVNGDHANDQLKVAQLEKEWKIDSWVNHLGSSALLNLNTSDAKALYESIQTDAEAEAGSLDTFSSLPLANQEDLLASEYQKRVWALGKAAFDKASPTVQQDMSCVVRGGCCAHKDMNATKGGASAMLSFWKTNKHLNPPVKLFNKDNDATMSLSDPLGETTEAGAIKLCSLAGAAYNHKDDKKGHQDSHAYWFAQKYSRFRRFPDTSNVRYSSYIDAATELCTFHSAYIEYMEHIRKQKATGRLNHLELNIVKALKCPATLAELISISLYGQIISKPYIRLVRNATAAGRGLADLALLHAQVQRHLRNIISNPSLILGLRSVLSSVTLDGSDWDNPEVLNALRDHGLELPYFTDLFVAFCQGALQAWIRFTEEFSPSAPVALLTPEQHDKAFMPPTNDANEGALGRVWARRFPSLALHKFNAINMNRANQTETYVAENFTLKQHKWIRAEGRRIDSSKLEANRKATIVTAQINEATKNEATLMQRDLPTYTATGSLITLAPASFTGVNAGSGWANTLDRQGLYTPVAGCAYPSVAWGTAGTGATQTACAAQRVVRGRHAMPLETGVPA
ncbi:hypothetical protein RSAG8_07625, partial [Rhizoctonia solani AG-8 WAC10335]